MANSMDKLYSSIVKPKQQTTTQVPKTKQQTTTQVSKQQPAPAPSAYQANLEKNLYKSLTTMNTNQVMARIGDISRSDPSRAEKIATTFQELQNTPSSRYFNPYRTVTNRAVGNLASMGIDTSNINNDWFQKNSWLKDHLIFDGTTNTPSKPGKKATAEQVAAYEYYQVAKAEEMTQKAEREWAALQEDIGYWTGRADRNYSDDEILEKIDWKKYPTLVAMDEAKGMGTSVELNRPVGYSKDAMSGVIWAARNGGGTGNNDMDCVNYTRGVGNQWQENPQTTAMLDASSNSFAPYAVGSTMDEECAYFGVDHFDDQWIADNAWRMNSPDETERRFYANVVDNHEKTKKLNEERALMSDKIAKMAQYTDDPDRIMKRLESDPELSDLFDLDKTMKNGKLIKTTGPVNYSRGIVEDEVRGACENQKTNYMDFTTSVVPMLTKGTDESEKGLDVNNLRTPTGTQESGTNASAGPGLKTSKVSETDKAIAEQDNKRYNDAAPAIMDHGTDGEKTAFTSGKTSFFTQAQLDLIAGMDSASKEGIRQLGDRAIRQSATQYMGSQQFVYNYEQEQQKAEDAAKELEGINGRLEEYHDMVPVSDSVWYHVQMLDSDPANYPEWNEVKQTLSQNPNDEKALMALFSYTHDYSFMDSSNASDHAAQIQEAKLTWEAYQMYAEDVTRAEEEYSSMDDGLDHSNDILSPGEGMVAIDDEEYETYMNLRGRKAELESEISDLNKWTDDHREDYEKAVADSTNYMNDWMYRVSCFGEGDEEANLAAIEGIKFIIPIANTYTPTNYSPFSTADMLVGEDGDTTRAFSYAKQGGEYYHKWVDQMRYVLDHADELGIDLSDEERKNIERWAEVGEREAYQCDSFMLRQLPDFDNVADDTEKRVLAGEFDNSPYAKWIRAVATGEYEADTSGPALILPIPGAGSGMTAQSFEVEQAAKISALIQLMSPAEKKTFFYKLSMDGDEEAQKYLNSLINNEYGMLNTRLTMKQQDEARNFASGSFLGDVAGSLLSFVTKVYGDVSNTFYRIGADALGREVNPNAPQRMWSNTTSALREGSKEFWVNALPDYPELAEFIGMAKDAIFTSGDSAINAALSSWALGGVFDAVSKIPFVKRFGDWITAAAQGEGIWGKVARTAISFAEGPVSEFIHALPMGYFAGNEAYCDAISRGASPDQANKIFVGTMLAESLSEAITFSNIRGAFRAGGGFVDGALNLDKQILQFIGGTLEEIFGESMNEMVEQKLDRDVMGTLSNYDRSVNELVASGVPESVARMRVSEQMSNEIWKTAIISFMSTAGHQAVGAGAGATINYLVSRGATADPGMYSIENAAAENAALFNAQFRDSTTQAIAVSAALYNGNDKFETDIARAAAQNLGSKVKNAPGLVRNILRAGKNTDSLKAAVTAASLTNGKSNAVLMELNEKVSLGEIITQEDANRLVLAAASDMMNKDIRQQMDGAVRENRIANRVNQKMSERVDQYEKKQQAADTAYANLQKAYEDLDKANNQVDAATGNLQAAEAEYDPAKQETHATFQQAMNELEGLIEARSQSEQQVDNAVAKVEETQKALGDNINEVLTQARLEAKQEIEQEDAERAETARQQAEFTRQQAEVEAAQKEERISDENAAAADREAFIDDKFADSSDEEKAHIRERFEQIRQQMQANAAATEQAGAAQTANGEQKPSAKQIRNNKKIRERISKTFNVPIEVRDTANEKTPSGAKSLFSNGYYDPNTKSIVIDKTTSVSDVMLKTLGHELVHLAEQSKTYTDLADTLLQIRYGDGVSYNSILEGMASGDQTSRAAADIRAKKARYEAALKRGLSYEYALQEIVADEMGRLLNGDKKLVDQLVQSNPSLIRRIIDAIKRFLGMSSDIQGEWQTKAQKAVNLLESALKQTKNGSSTETQGTNNINDVINANGWVIKSGYSPEFEDYDTVNYVYDQNGEELGYVVGDSIKATNNRRVLLDAGLADNNGDDYFKAPEGKRFSIPQSETAKTIVEDEDGNAVATELRGGTVYVDDGVKYSLNSFTSEEQARVRAALLAKKDENGKQEFTEAEVDKYMDDAMSIARMIASDPKRLDFDANPAQRFLKPNNDYYFTLDASTLCAKRLLYQGTFDYVQHALPNEVFTPEDLIDLVNIMNEMGYETPCGICYVESRRRWLDTYANEFLETVPKDPKSFVYKRFKKASDEEKTALIERLSGEMPSIDDLTTSDGLERLRNNDPLMHKAFVAAMNAKGTMNPKVVQLRTEYRGDIGKLSAKDIQKVKDIGGLRIQSFSDFETPHLLDMIQAVMDMASVGLTSQAYTKVPNFAWVFGDTGIKINLSLIGKGTGLDADGNLVFDNVEGMNFDEAMRLRDRYNKNVGTILVGINDDHIIAAMGDSRIDFIIPFHKSGWSAEELRKMPTLNNYNDYTDTQNERLIIGRNADGSYETESFKKHKDRTKESFENFQPVGKNGYWNFKKSGQWNAELYLKKCAESGRVPKFSQFLVDNGDGSFSLPQGTDQRSTFIREGYWKTLIDFKMYENDAYGRTREDGTKTEVKGSKQQAVKPNINMNQAYRVMNEYTLGRQMPDRENGIRGKFIPMEDNNSVPVAVPAAEEYIERIKRKREVNKPTGPDDSLEATPEIDVGSLGPSQFRERGEGVRNTATAAAAAMMAGSNPVLGNTESTEQFEAAETRAMAIDAETGETVRYSLPDAVDKAIDEMSLDELLGYLGLDLNTTKKAEAEEERKAMTVAVKDIKDEFDPTIYNGKLYVKPKTLEHWLSGGGFASSNPRYAQAYITTMNPADFLRMTTVSEQGQQRILNEAKPLDKERFAKNADRQPIYLMIDEESGKVVGHEGRHRSVALARAGVTEMPVLLFDSATKYSKEAKAELTLQGQDFYENENGNELTFRDVVPLSSGNHDLIVDRFTAKAEDEAAAAANNQNVLRYSLPEDAPYMAAVERGETDVVQQMVDEKAKDAGYVLSSYHGTGEYFNVFNRGDEGIHLGNREQAEQVSKERYNTRSKMSFYRWGDIKGKIDSMNSDQRESLVKDAYLEQDYIGDGISVPPFDGSLDDADAVYKYSNDIYERYGKDSGTDPNKIQIRMRTFDRKTGENLMRLYARINNPLVINGDIGEWTPAAISGVILNRADGAEEIRKYNGTNVDITGSDFILNDEQRENLRKLQYMELSGDARWDLLAKVLNELGYDGIKYLNQYEGDKNSYSYIALSPNDVKSADPVTYDDQGNIIPLSERFNAKKDDIRYSLPEDAPYMAAVERGDEETEQRIVDEKAEEAGYTKAAYHGTLNGGFTIFDKAYAGIGGNSGAGFYFSNNIDDSNSNYSDVEGADNWFKARNLADKILEEFRESDEEDFEYEGYQITEGMPFDDVVEIAKKILTKNPETYHVYLDPGKAYIRDFNNSTNLLESAIDGFDESSFNRDDYDSEDDYYDDISMRKSDEIYQAISDAVYNGFSDVESNYEIYSNVDIESIVGKLSEIAMDYESLTWGDLIKVLENESIDIGTDNMEEPTDGSHEIARAIVEAFGYDSIEDREVSKKFNQLKNMGDTGDTVHYIMFHPNQIKLADPVTYDNQGNIIPPSERFRKQSNDIRYELPSDDILDQMIREYLENGGSLPEDGTGEIPGIPGTRDNPNQRQFGSQTAQKNPVMAPAVNDMLANYSGYTPDSNNAQVQRAYKWISEQATPADPDGFYNALDAVSSSGFQYHTADGQARTLAVLSMAVARKDTLAQAKIAEAYNTEGTDIARALQARKIYLRMTPEGRIESMQRVVNNLNKDLEKRGKPGNIHLSEESKEALRNANTDEKMDAARKQVRKDLAEQLPADWKDKLRALRMLSMLFNPRTHIRNILGNAMFIAEVGMKNKLGAIGEIITRQDERTKTLRPFLNREARRFATADAIANRDVLTGEAKYSDRGKIMSERQIFGTGDGLISRTLGRAVNWLSEKNSGLLEGEDWVFLKGHYRRALGGWMMANHYTAEQLQNNPELLQQGREYAISEAQKATYRDASKIAEKLNNLSKGGGPIGFLVDAALPFKKTPANILRRGIEYSPVGILKAAVYDSFRLKEYLDYQNGKRTTLSDNAISPTQYIDKVCSGLSGTAIAALGFLMASAGFVTAGLGDDDDEFDKLRGDQKYAVRLFGLDVTFTIDWAAPACMPFFLGAGIFDQMDRNGGAFDFGDMQAVLNGILEMTEPVFNLSMLDGVNSLFKTSQYDDTNELTQILAKVGLNYVSSFVPSVLGAITRTIDPIRRKAYVENGKGTGPMGTFNYTVEQTENKIPGLSQSNIPVRDAFGRIEDRPIGKRILENFVLPGYVSEIKNDPVVNELESIYKATGNKRMIPSLPGKTISVGGQSVSLTAEEYDQITERRGQTAYGLLEQVMATDYWKLLEPEDQAAIVEDIWTYSTQTANYSVNSNFNMTNWVVNAQTNPLQAILNRSEDNVHKNNVDGHVADAFTALKNEDMETFWTNLEWLKDNKETGKLRTQLTNTYKSQYVMAYQNGDDPTMLRIENMLVYISGLYTQEDLDKWITAADAQVEERDNY